MSDLSKTVTKVPPEQEVIRAKCFHPTGTFVEFKEEDVAHSIPARFENIACRHPERLAVKAGDRSLTYQELNRAANRIARAILAERGDGSVPIALLFEDRIDQIVAILGAFKAGKCYIVLEPSLPLERLDYIVEDSHANLIVTNAQSGGIANRLAPGSRRLLAIEALDSSRSSANPSLALPPGALAYLIYTSGSTGKPKGVVQNHVNLLQEIMAYTNAFKITPQDRMTLLASCSSGQGIKNAFSALLNGAALFPFDVRTDGVARFVDHLIRERITLCHLSVTLFRYLAQILDGKRHFPDLRLIRLASQQVCKKDVESFKRYFSRDCVLVNALSSTETGTFRWYFMNHATSISEDDGVPVGYAVDGKDIVLLDADRNPLFEGVGEIAVKSRYLSPGYWRKPEITESKFLPQPNAREERLYLTGDLGRLLLDGCLVYLGRKDLRVKIRGYSVEIPEIEKALLAHTRVKDAAVAAWDRDPGEKYLVAYVVPQDDPAPATNELVDYLKKRFPDHMIPSSFVFSETLPLTNGKLNRSALPSPKPAKPSMDHPYVSPRSGTEKRLIQVVEDILDVRPIGIHDDFFTLGGHSLLGAKLIARIRDDFLVDLSLRTLFERPTIAALAECVEDACRQEPEMRAWPMPVASSAEKIPLSFSQQRLWFLDQLNPQSIAYNLFSAFRLRGPLNLDALRSSFEAVVARHEILRTVFHAVDGQPYQHILSSVKADLPVIDLRNINSKETRETELRRLSVAIAQRPFDLTRGPLWRAHLLRLTDDEYVLNLALHHTIFDGWSMGVLCRELSTLYETFSNGRPSVMPGLRVQYQDFARWQRQSLQEQAIETQLAYWKKQLQDSPTLNLTAGPSCPGLSSSRGARHFFALSQSLSDAVKTFSRRCGTTLFMTLLAAYQALLNRYTGQIDIVIGSPTAGRKRSEFDGMIGFFLNNLVLRTDLSGNPTFRELLARVKETCLAAYAHDDLPFEKLVEALRPERDPSRNPFFQVTFALQNTPFHPLELGGLTVEQLEVESGIARFDLSLLIEEENSRLRGYLDYKTDLFDTATIERMIGHFRVLLESIVANPDRRLSDLPILTGAEKHQLLIAWNDTKRQYPKNKCIHRLFEEQVERTPDAVAVVFGDQQFTYREVNQHANQLAHYLMKKGVGPEVLVGIWMERSVEMVVALLGVLKAGGGYVPLDPSYPRERLAFMLADSQVFVLLTQEKFRANSSQSRAIYLDGDWHKIARESARNPESAARAENLAYVIYTSGSTGKPKGVMITHRAICNHMLWMQSALPLSHADCVLQKTPLSFDASVWEFYAPLLAGAKLVLAPPEAHQDMGHLVTLIATRQITTLQLVPSILKLLLDEEGLKNCRSLKRVFCGGEALPSDLPSKFFERIGAELYNLYGPTEATIDVTCGICKRATADGGSVALGRPLANTQLYVLDNQMKPVPVGIPGELYIGGDGLARGYLNRPDLTAERFVSHPFSDEPGSRLYRTGDRVRYLRDGEIEFLGRLDHQVKIRGIRVEPGEIEAALAQHPAVRDAVVLAQEHNPGDTRLVAYVVPKPETAPASQSLRSFLKEKLPDYMVPSAFVLLDGIPLAPNGKLDRKALPVPEQPRRELAEIFFAPRTAVEQLLASIWAKVLHVDKVGVNDNFFDLGGHSLLATQVVSRMRAAFQINFPLRILFENQSIEELAKAMIELPNKGTAADTIVEALTQVESLSDEEAEGLVAKEKSAGGNGTVR